LPLCVAASVLGCFDSRRFAFVAVEENRPAPDAGSSSSLVLPGPAAPLPLPPGAAGSESGIGEAALDQPVAAPDASPDAGSVAPAAVTCDRPATAEAGAVLFSGTPVGAACPTSLDAPYGTTWFAYQDNADLLTLESVAPSCDPALCSLHVEGPAAGNPGYSAYGAGVALPLALDNTPVDLSRFAGVQLWARGTIAGTRGLGAADAPQTLFLKVVTTTARNGDDFGVHCEIDPAEWSVCRAEFAAFGREGFSTPDVAVDVFDLQSALRVELELRLFRDAVGAVPVPVSAAFDVAQISFF
jgi:hypothetical protein